MLLHGTSFYLELRNRNYFSRCIFFMLKYDISFNGKAFDIMSDANVQSSAIRMSGEEELESADSEIEDSLNIYNNRTGRFGAPINTKTKSKAAKSNRSLPRMSTLYGTLRKLYHICFSYYCGERELGDNEELDERIIDKPVGHLPVRMLLGEASKRLEGRDLKVDRRLVSSWSKVIEALFEKSVSEELLF